MVDSADHVQCVSFAGRFAPGELLNAYRPYLLCIANQELDSKIRPKVGASDIVQDSLLEAYQAIPGFCGRTTVEFKSWLRQILRHNLANSSRHFQQTKKRNLDREVSLDDTAQLPLRRRLQDAEGTPSEVAGLSEDIQRLQLALEGLTLELRQLVVWHNLELQTFREIGVRLGRSEKSVQLQWARAIRELRIRMAHRQPS